MPSRWRLLGCPYSSGSCRNGIWHPRFATFASERKRRTYPNVSCLAVLCFALRATSGAHGASFLCDRFACRVPGRRLHLGLTPRCRVRGLSVAIVGTLGDPRARGGVRRTRAAGVSTRAPGAGERPDRAHGYRLLGARLVCVWAASEVGGEAVASSYVQCVLIDDVVVWVADDWRVRPEGSRWEASARTAERDRVETLAGSIDSKAERILTVVFPEAY